MNITSEVAFYYAGKPLFTMYARFLGLMRLGPIDHGICHKRKIIGTN